MKPTDKHQKVAQELMARDKKTEVFVNEDGEFFYNQNSAALSVKGDKEKFVKIEAKGTAKADTAEAKKVADAKAKADAAEAKKVADAKAKADAAEAKAAKSTENHNNDKQ